MDAKNNGIVIAWPMPMRRSRVIASPAIVSDSVAKNADPSTTASAAAISRSGLAVKWTPRIRARTRITMTWLKARIDAANALPVTRAARGVGVTRSLASTPASRSQITWMP